MSHSVPWFIGLRYIRSKRRNGYIAFVSLFALLGMLLGVFALIVVLSVMNGFDHELKSRILRVIPHGFIATEKPLKEWESLSEKIAGNDGLKGSAPFIEGKGLIGYGRSVRGVEIQGIDPVYETAVSELGDNMLVGHIDNLHSGEYGIILGSIIARHLGVTTEDKISLTLPVMSITPAGIFPRSKRFTVVGVFEVGAQVDQTLVMIHLNDAQKLFRMPGQIHGLRLNFDDLYRAPDAVKIIAGGLGEGYSGKDWSQTQGSLFQAVKMEKTVVGIMLGVIIAIAAFNIVTSLIMMVTEKRSDIAVLRTLGMTRQDIIKIFMVQGTAMGLVGIFVGAVSGVIVAHYLSDIMAALESLMGFQMFDKNVYFVSYLPSVWHLEDTLITCGFAVVVSFLATIYPSYRAATIEPAEALRYDL
ncbi:MAG: lipoprotein-releasing ABC transporter permease subunit [Agarilytica sp.]